MIASNRSILPRATHCFARVRFGLLADFAHRHGADQERRTPRTEQNGVGTGFLSLVLWFLRERGYEELVKVAQGEIPRFLLLAVDDTDILDLEEFRGLVPDEDIRAAYSF
jgi:hypothetical protein